MSIQQYSVNQHPIQTLLTWSKSGEIAIPEIQRPFVWSATKVRDLIDSSRISQLFKRKIQKFNFYYIKVVRVEKFLSCRRKNRKGANIISC
jgi:uncharacterized protein with ParB-like and HNH nuclease domain